MTETDIRALNEEGEGETIEFESQSGDLVVRFFPTGYVPPSRISHDLSDLQKELLHALSRADGMALSLIEANLTVRAAQRTIQENLNVLRTLGLIRLDGHGRGALWRLVG